MLINNATTRCNKSPQINMWTKADKGMVIY